MKGNGRKYLETSTSPRWYIIVNMLRWSINVHDKGNITKLTQRLNPNRIVKDRFGTKQKLEHTS